jgi:hypothetical protein
MILREGHTITVDSGTYYEHVDVHKQLIQPKKINIVVYLL